MRSRAVRVIGLIGFGLGPAILFTGCGAEETGARTTLNSIQPSSYVVRPPVTTTTTVPEGDQGPDVDDEGRSSQPQEYTVQGGDAVSLIANRFGISMDKLAAFNEWPNGINQAIFPGDVIGIPPGALVPNQGVPETGSDTATETATPGAAPSTTLPGADGECVPGVHVIAANEFPNRVAEQYDITLEQLQNANVGNPAMTQFIVGQELRIPCD